MKKIKNYKVKAIKKLQENFNHISKKKIEKIVNKYIQTVINEINRYPVDMSLNMNFANVRINEIARKAGRYQLNKESKEIINISKWFYKNLPLYSIWIEGNNLTGKMSVIKMNYQLRVAVNLAYESAIKQNTDTDMDEQLSLFYGDAYDELKAHTDEKPTVDIVPINMKSLKAYIDTTQYFCDNKKKYNKNKLKLRIQYAKQVYVIAKLFDGLLPQVIKISEFGRKYYKGTNLQSAPKDVRHAALGKCIEFDIANSVYAWRYDVVKEINPNAVYAETLDYLDRKQYWRDEIANYVFSDEEHMTDEIKVNIIKRAFTAISFGAKGTINNFTWDNNGTEKTFSLNTIITSTYKRELFFEHSFVKRFIEEQKGISETIFNVIKKDIKKLPCFKGKKRLSRNVVLAYLYQQHESLLMKGCIKQIPKDDFLLLVHDAFYVKRLSAERILNIKQILLENNKELKLGRTDYKAYEAYDYGEQAHREFIKQETLRAKNHKIKNMDILQ